MRAVLRLTLKVPHQLPTHIGTISTMQQQLSSRGLARTWAPAATSRRSLHVTASSASVSGYIPVVPQCRSLLLDSTTQSAAAQLIAKAHLTDPMALILTLQAIQSTIADNKVVVYSATYCPYCAQVSIAAAQQSAVCGFRPDSLTAGQTALLLTMQHTQSSCKYGTINCVGDRARCPCNRRQLNQGLRCRRHACWDCPFWCSLA